MDKKAFQKFVKDTKRTWQDLGTRVSPTPSLSLYHCLSPYLSLVVHLLSISIYCFHHDIFFLYLLPIILHTHSPSNSLFLSSDPLIFPSPTPLLQDRIEDSSSAENGHLAAEKTHSFPTTGGLSHSLSNSGLTPAVLVAQVNTLTLSH